MTESTRLHQYDAADEALAQRVFGYVRERAQHQHERLSPPPTATELNVLLDGAITADGIGHERAFDLFTEVVTPNCLTPEHPRFLAFVSYAPAVGAVLFDAAL